MDIDLFLSQNKNHQENVTKFLTQKKPELLEQPAIDLIAQCNNCPPAYKIPLNELNIPRDRFNILLAKEFLVWHALGKFTEAKRFILEHELGHASGYNQTKSLGEFDPSEFDFIKPNQFGEVRADLSAAREANAHEVGIMIFEWQSILSEQPDENDVHPTAANRAKVLKIDLEKRQKSKTAS